MRPTNRRIFFVSAILVVIIGLPLLGIGFAGYWLQYSDMPEQADAIIVLAGNPARAFYAADLYLKGYASKVYISRPIRLHHERLLDALGVSFPYAEEICRQVLLKKGIPNSDILIFSKPVISTVEEAEVVKEFFKNSKYRLLIITSPYHTRRTKMIFKNVLKGYNIRVIGTPYEPFPKKWWTDQDAARNVILEVFKILYYKVGGSFHSKA